MYAMRLMSLNVEEHRHWDTIHALADAENPDVFCFQELLASDARAFADERRLQHFFVPMALAVHPELPEDGPLDEEGIGIFSRYPILSRGSSIYFTPSHTELLPYDKDRKRETCRHVLAYASVYDGADEMLFATTHFTWTPDGFSSPEQYVDMQALLNALSAVPPHVLCGDFNIPRGYNELYDFLTLRYRDCIPQECTGSLDPLHHRTANNPADWPRLSRYMVDYILAMPEYTVEHVSLEFGVSDHAAVLADVSLSGSLSR